MLIINIYDWCVKVPSSFGSHGLVEDDFLAVYINKNLIFCLQSWSFLLHHHEPDIWKLVSLRALYQGKIDIYVCCFYSTIWYLFHNCHPPLFILFLSLCLFVSLLSLFFSVFWCLLSSSVFLHLPVFFCLSVSVFFLPLFKNSLYDPV